jgi:hypothetical protein
MPLQVTTTQRCEAHPDSGSSEGGAHTSASGFSLFAPRTLKQRRERGAASTLMMMRLSTSVLLIPCYFAGLHRQSHSDMSVWSRDAFAHFMTWTSFGTNWFGNEGISKAKLGCPRLLRLVAISFPIGTVVEMLAPLCIVHKRFRKMWVMSIVGLNL